VSEFEKNIIMCRQNIKKKKLYNRTKSGPFEFQDGPRKTVNIKFVC